MAEWPDPKIRSTALWCIGRNAMDPATWRFTTLGEVPPAVMSRGHLQSGELPVVGYLHPAGSWYLLTTRRGIGGHAGRPVEASPVDVIEEQFGNFKGHGCGGLEVMTLRLADGREAAPQYETGRASMAPIYYFRYWRIKYPILDKLRADPDTAGVS